MWLIRIYRVVMGVVLVVWEFLLRVCSSAERPMHFLKVQLQVPEGTVPPHSRLPDALLTAVMHHDYSRWRAFLVCLLFHTRSCLDD